MKNELNLKISIITVCFNSEETIEKAILSVISQTYSNVEYIIIDGQSTDGTIDIIKKYEDEIAYWSSEPDNGIYDAMNKALLKASGDYIYFLGSDDLLFQNNCIEIISQIIKSMNLKEKIDIFYGNIMMVDGNLGLQKKIGREFFEVELLNGQMIPHQGMFTSRQLLIKNLFNTKYKLAADFDFLIRVLEKEIKIKYVDQIIAYYNVNGSSSHDKLRFKEYIDILDDEMNMNKVKNFHMMYFKSKIYKILIYGCKKLKIAKKVKLFLGWHKIGENQ